MPHGLYVIIPHTIVNGVTITINNIGYISNCPTPTHANPFGVGVGVGVGWCRTIDYKVAITSGSGYP